MYSKFDIFINCDATKVLWQCGPALKLILITVKMTSFDRTWSPATHSVSTRGHISHIWHKNENKVQENVLDESRTQICYDRSNLDTFVQVGRTQDHPVPCRTHTKTAVQCVHPNIAYGLDEHQTKAWTCGTNLRQMGDFVGWTSDCVGRNLDKIWISRTNNALPSIVFIRNVTLVSKLSPNADFSLVRFRGIHPKQISQGMPMVIFCKLNMKIILLKTLVSASISNTLVKHTSTIWNTHFKYMYTIFNNYKLTPIFHMEN